MAPPYDRPLLCRPRLRSVDVHHPHGDHPAGAEDNRPRICELGEIGHSLVFRAVNRKNALGHRPNDADRGVLPLSSLAGGVFRMRRRRRSRTRDPLVLLSRERHLAARKGKVFLPNGGKGEHSWRSGARLAVPRVRRRAQKAHKNGPQNVLAIKPACRVIPNESIVETEQPKLCDDHKVEGWGVGGGPEKGNLSAEVFLSPSFLRFYPYF